MASLLSFVFTFILILVATAMDRTSLLYAALAVSVFGAVAAALKLRGGAGRGQIEEDQEVGVTLQDREKLEADFQEAKTEIESLNGQLEEKRRQEAGYGEGCVFVEKAVEAERTFAEVINEKTEKATQKLTDHVYSLAESSRKVGVLIDEAIGHITTGEGGLKEDVVQLEKQLRVIEELITEFKRIRDGYAAEMETIEGTMRQIDAFTDTITDLAERTSVLAINASIEAARAGNSGKGFAVIAGEVQKLAGNTKSIAEQINTTVEESVHKVKESIEQYGTRIERSVNLLEKSGSEHSKLIELLNPQIEKVSDVVSHSQELSAAVTKDLNEVTVHLQYQDSVRQMLEHMITVIEKVSEKGRALIGSVEEPDQSNKERIEEELRSLVSETFTTREEWEAFGFSLNEDFESNKREEDGSELNGELTGDVTLF